MSDVYEGGVVEPGYKKTLSSSSEPEFGGVHAAGPNPALKTEGGSAPAGGGREEKGFDVEDLRGPQPMSPGATKIVNPDDVSRS